MLKGKLGFKGERGYSAYEIAVQNGFVGTEQDWLAQLGTSVAINQYYSPTKTTTADEDTFSLPEEYTSNSYVEVYVNGKRLTQEEFTVDETDREVELTTPIAEIGTTVEVVATTMTTNELPIVDTMDSSSTNNTTPGTKLIYDTFANYYTKSQMDTSLGNKANSSNVYTKLETDNKLNLKANSTDVYTKTQSDDKYQPKVLSGTSEPSSSLGNDGDIYFQYSE